MSNLDRRGAFKAERAQVLAFCEQLTPAEWHADSCAEGWRIQDVVAHMGAGVHAMFGPAASKLLLGKDIEKLNDDMVDIRRDRSPEAVLGEYRRWTGVFATVMPPLAATPLGGVGLPLAELGKFPLRLFISALVFDTYTHLRHDMAPAVGRDVNGVDANRLAVAFEWMMAVLGNQLRAARPGWLDRPLTISLTGPGGGLWRVDPSGTVEPTGLVSGAAVITGLASQFPEWGTRRANWHERDVQITGDAEYGTVFLDAMNIV